jgi:hypothetical protein
MNVIQRTAMAAILGLALASAATAATASTPAFPVYTGPPSKTNPSVKPAQVYYSGDGSEFFAGKKIGSKAGKLHWTVWNGTEGLGTGYDWINNCSPDCAQGKFSLYPVTLKVYRPEKESKYFIFTRLTVTYTHKKFGPKKTFTWKVSYANKNFQLG